MSRQLFSKKVLLAKIETVYGTDSTPLAATNAILTRGLTASLFQGNTEEIDYDRPYLGSGKQLYTGPHTTVQFECDFSGSGAVTAPAWGPLLRGCGMAETNRATNTGTATATTISSVTLAAAASAVDGFYVGQAITIAGQTRTISAYVGSTKVATVSPSFATVPTVGTYTVLAQFDYKFVSDSFASLTLYFYWDGELHKLIGSRGTATIALAKESLPKMNFTFTGLRVAPSIAALPVAPNFASFTEPLPVNNTNSSNFSLFGFAPCFEELSIDLGNNVVYRNLVGCEEVSITDRAPTGSVSFEKPLLSDFNYDASIAANTTGNFTATHGIVTNFIVGVSGRCQLTNPSFNDSDGIVALSGDLRLVPTDAGNDELTIFAR